MIIHNLDDVPLDLIERCGVLIRTWNEQRPLNFEKILWHRETMAMLMIIQDTQELLALANRAWRKKTKDQNLGAACAAVMALEILNLDFCSWGGLHPAAKRKAAELLQFHSEEDKQRMMMIFNVSEGKPLFDPHASPFGTR